MTDRGRLRASASPNNHGTAERKLGSSSRSRKAMKTSTPEMTLSGKITESGSRPKGEWQYQSADQSDCFVHGPSKQTSSTHPSPSSASSLEDYHLAAANYHAEALEKIRNQEHTIKERFDCLLHASPNMSSLACKM